MSRLFAAGNKTCVSARASGVGGAESLMADLEKCCHQILASFDLMSLALSRIRFCGRCAQVLPEWSCTKQGGPTFILDLTIYRGVLEPETN